MFIFEKMNCKNVISHIIHLSIAVVALLFVFVINGYVNAAPSKYIKSFVVMNNITVNAGESESIPIKINVINSASKKITYKVKNKKIAKVSYNAKMSKLIIKGVKAGTTKITITTKARNYKGKKLKKVIRVNVKRGGVTTEATTQKATNKNATEKTTESKKNEKTYTFRKQSYLTQHYEKHGEEVGCKSEEEYLAAANAVINNPKALHKLEAEDNDHIYFIEDTNEIVFLSQDGYIRTYFICKGKDYYDRQ